MSGKQVLALDFDGVLHDYRSGDWKGPNVIEGQPVPGAVEFCWQASKHFVVHVFSSRNRHQEGRKAMRRWLRKWGFPKMRFPLHKPSAFLFIDDRAMCFTGTFPEPKELLQFQPWHARPP